MEIDLFFVREMVLAKQLTVQHIAGDDQWADVLTKPVSTAKFLSLRPKLNVTATPVDQKPTWACVCMCGGRGGILEYTYQ